MMNKTILMLSVSCMSFIAGAGLCYAGFNPDDTPPVLSAAMLKSHVSTHTSHLTAAHLSSLEDFDKDDLFVTLTRSLRSDLSGSISVAGGATLSRCGHSVCNAHFASLPLAYELTNSRLSLKISPPEIFSASSPQGRGGKDKIKLAAACFVTDTTNCSGNEFSGNNADDDGHGAPGGGTPGGDNDNQDDYDLNNEERCKKEGYTQTNCPDGYEPNNLCPYDSDYFEKCVESCPSDYKECEEPYYGIGEACDGKYASCECTPCGAGYDYTTIPEGYVQDGEACLDCDGKTKYKIKPNPCDGYMDCGNMGPEIGAGTCQSGNETLYDNCKPCPYECSLSSCPSPYICTKEECSGMYCKSGCQSGYDWNESSKTCTQQCPSSYKYDESNCPSSRYFHCDYSTCNGKYTDCIEPLSTSNTFSYYGMTFATDPNYCPGIKAFAYINGDYHDPLYTNDDAYSIQGINGKRYYPCVDADQACYDTYLRIKAKFPVDISQDMYCGNLSFPSGTINGNGHTLTFDKPFGFDFGGGTISNLTIISWSTNRFLAKDYPYSSCDNMAMATNEVFHKGNFNIKLNNVTVKAQKDPYGACESGICNFQGLPGEEGLPSMNNVVFLPPVGVTVNIRDIGYMSLTVGSSWEPGEEWGIINIKNVPTIRYNIYSAGGSFTFNVCNGGVDLIQCGSRGETYDETSFSSYIINTTSNVDREEYKPWDYESGCSGYISPTVNVNANLCSDSIFSGSFWTD